MNPITRIEYYLANLAGQEVAIPEPITRQEMFLAYLCGERETMPEPITRIERYMAHAAGLDITRPNPITREEFFWYDYQGGSTPTYKTAGPASIISIDDALAALLHSYSIDISPVQDLHGYANPWPAGGGKNKLPNTATTSTIQGVTFTVNSDGTIKANGTSTGWTGLTVSTFTLQAGDYRLVAKAGSAYQYNLYLSLMSGSTSLVSTSNGDTPATFSLTEATNITCKLFARPNQVLSNITVYPMILLQTEADTTYLPYSNICPISGWTGANLIVRGKNLWRISHLNKTSHNGLTFAIADDESSIIVNGTATANANVTVALKNQRIIPDGTYTYSCSSGASMMMTKYAGGQSRWINSGASFTKAGVDFPEYAYVTFASGSSYTNERITFQLETGTTATAFEPYQGDDLSIDWSSTAGTVYGGSLHVNEDGSGTLTVDRGYAALGAFTWESYNVTQGKLFRLASLSSVIKNMPTTVAANLICSMYRTVAQNQRADLTIQGNNKYVDIIDNRFSTAEAFKAAMTENNVQLVYELATPQTYTLTAPQISTLLGSNVMWADTGEMTIEYQSKAAGRDDQADS